MRLGGTALSHLLSMPGWPEVLALLSQSTAAFGVGRDSLNSCSILFDSCSEGRKAQFPQKSDNKMKISFVERKEPREQGREPREELTGVLLWKKFRATWSKREWSQSLRRLERRTDPGGPGGK